MKTFPSASVTLAYVFASQAVNIGLSMPKVWKLFSFNTASLKTVQGQCCFFLGLELGHLCFKQKVRHAESQMFQVSKIIPETFSALRNMFVSDIQNKKVEHFCRSKIRYSVYVFGSSEMQLDFTF